MLVSWNQVQYVTWNKVSRAFYNDAFNKWFRESRMTDDRVQRTLYKVIFYRILRSYEKTGWTKMTFH